MLSLNCSFILSSFFSNFSYKSDNEGTFAIKVSEMVFLGPDMLSLSVNSK